MSIQTIFLITLALIVALGFSFFQYLPIGKKRNKNSFVFFSLRFLVIFLLLLLLINPKISKVSYELEKPNLVLAIDNSSSIEHLEQVDTINSIINSIVEDEELQANFKIDEFRFGETILTDKNALYDENQTNISAALEEFNDLYKKKNSAVILISDGNQTMGRDYRYFSPSKNLNIYPIVVGDTGTYRDLQLSKLNVNRYAFLNNKFPVEAIITYTGDQTINSKFEIRSGKSVVFSQPIEFSKDNNSQIISTELPATRLGVQSYTASVIPLENEKNILNNSENFGIEVIDERTKILLLAGISHPDLGALKKSIETNKQRQVDIKFINDEDLKIKEYQLVILYQPNSKFSSVFTEVSTQKLNHWIITGNSTNWSFLNSTQTNFQKYISSEPQEYFAVPNKNFNSFQLDDIGFTKFPPLEDKFGKLNFSSNKFNPILFQKIAGVQTDQPLLAISSEHSPKVGLLFGENIWKWRAQVFVKNNSFQQFDEYIGKIVQNLASNKLKERLVLDYESFYYENQKMIISAQFFDENYEFDPRQQLVLHLKEADQQEVLKANFIQKGNNYEIDLSNLKSGEYNFTVEAEGIGISRTGRFSIISYNVEQQFTTANLNGMKQLSSMPDKNVFNYQTLHQLKKNLLEDKRYAIVQKSNEKAVPLVEWYFLLFLIIALLSGEWFYRKYTGLI